MEVIIQPNAEEAALLTALLIARRLAIKPQSVLGLATGRTMETVYKLLAEMHKNEGVDFSQCTTFNLDEYVGVSPESADSYRYYMNKQLFDHINIDKKNTHVLDGTAPSLAEECVNYEQKIQDAGGIDLQLLGIGNDGHIGFNEPLSSLMSRTREKALTPETIRQNAVLFKGDESKVPHRSLTMGVGTILQSSEIVLLATGKAKAKILSLAVEGPVTAMISATALQLHPNCKIVTDKAAAVHLKGTEYYEWIYQHEPEWRELATMSQGRLQ